MLLLALVVLLKCTIGALIQQARTTRDQIRQGKFNTTETNIFISHNEALCLAPMVLFSLLPLVLFWIVLYPGIATVHVLGKCHKLKLTARKNKDGQQKLQIWNCTTGAFTGRILATLIGPFLLILATLLFMVNHSILHSVLISINCELIHYEKYVWFLLQDMTDIAKRGRTIRNEYPELRGTPMTIGELQFNDRLVLEVDDEDINYNHVSFAETDTTVVNLERGYVGLKVSFNTNGSFYQVDHIDPQGLAFTAGVFVGLVILEVNGELAIGVSRKAALEAIKSISSSSKVNIKFGVIKPRAKRMLRYFIPCDENNIYSGNSGTWGASPTLIGVNKIPIAKAGDDISIVVEELDGQEINLYVLKNDMIRIVLIDGTEQLIKITQDILKKGLEIPYFVPVKITNEDILECSLPKEVKQGETIIYMLPSGKKLSILAWCDGNKHGLVEFNQSSGETEFSYQDLLDQVEKKIQANTSDSKSCCQKCLRYRRKCRCTVFKSFAGLFLLFMTIPIVSVYSSGQDILNFWTIWIVFYGMGLIFLYVVIWLFGSLLAKEIDDVSSIPSKESELIVCNVKRNFKDTWHEIEYDANIDTLNTEQKNSTCELVVPSKEAEQEAEQVVLKSAQNRIFYMLPNGIFAIADDQSTLRSVNDVTNSLPENMDADKSIDNTDSFKVVSFNYQNFNICQYRYEYISTTTTDENNHNLVVPNCFAPNGQLVSLNVSDNIADNSITYRYTFQVPKWCNKKDRNVVENIRKAFGEKINNFNSQKRDVFDQKMNQQNGLNRGQFLQFPLPKGMIVSEKNMEAAWISLHETNNIDVGENVTGLQFVRWCTSSGASAGMSEIITDSIVNQKQKRQSNSKSRWNGAKRIFGKIYANKLSQSVQEQAHFNATIHKNRMIERRHNAHHRLQNRLAIRNGETAVVVPFIQMQKFKPIPKYIKSHSVSPQRSTNTSSLFTTDMVLGLVHEHRNAEEVNAIRMNCEQSLERNLQKTKREQMDAKNKLQQRLVLRKRAKQERVSGS